MYEGLVMRLREVEEMSKAAVFNEAMRLTGKAADAIEELNMRLHGDEAAISGMKREIERMVVNQPRWIPVAERLPECELGAEVRNIEWISNGRVFAGCFGRGGKWRDAYFRTWTDGNEGIDAKDADYWRAALLPQPLKTEAE